MYGGIVVIEVGKWWWDSIRFFCFLCLFLDRIWVRFEECVDFLMNSVGWLDLDEVIMWWINKCK